jgi:CRP/FNR family transcriptional regulator, cyclic AMP receptor protein
MRQEGQTKYDIDSFLSALRLAKRKIRYRKNETIFSQGDPSTEMFYIESGALKLSVVSAAGKGAVIAIKGGGTLLGESCIALGQPVRFHSAVALTELRLVKIDRAAILQMLSAGGEKAISFISFLLQQNANLQEDLAARLVGSTQQSLARVVSSLREFEAYQHSPLLPHISQETIAETLGITRQRVNALMKAAGATQASVRPSGKGTPHS